MNDNGTDVVGMSFEGCNFLGGIIVVDSNLEIIGAAHNPILAGNKSTCSYGNICELEGFDNCLKTSQLL